METSFAQELLLAHEAALQTLEATVSQEDARGRIAALQNRVAVQHEFFYAAVEDYDDEIVNWTCGEVGVALSSAVWSMSGGWYSGAICQMRTALDVGIAALYFIVREMEGGQGDYERFYVEWDRGDRDTPNWGEMTEYLEGRPQFASLKAAKGLTPISDAYDHFKALCAYSHGAAVNKDGEMIRAIDTNGLCSFDENLFDTAATHLDVTIQRITALWAGWFPKAMTSRPATDTTHGPT